MAKTTAKEVVKDPTSNTQTTPEVTTPTATPTPTILAEGATAPESGEKLPSVSPIADTAPETNSTPPEKTEAELQAEAKTKLGEFQDKLNKAVGTANQAKESSKESVQAKNESDKTKSAKTPAKKEDAVDADKEFADKLKPLLWEFINAHVANGNPDVYAEQVEDFMTKSVKGYKPEKEKE